jgi:hypothetical protein
VKRRPPPRAVPDGPGRSAALLAALPPADWARLLAVLRDRAADPDVAPGWATQLEAPTSDLAHGPRRRALCDALAADRATLAVLAADASLSDVTRAALAEDPQAEQPATGAGTPSAAAAGRERERDLRREIDTLRRQRDGAVARAQAAEARLEDAAAELAGLRAELERSRTSVGSLDEGIERAVARAERRSAARIELLEATLAEERAAAERTRRAGERQRVELADARVELAAARDELAILAPQVVADATAPRRPLRLPPSLDPVTTDGARWLLERAEELLLDGYNITLTQRPGEELEAQRRWLIERVRPLTARGWCLPVIVFDGDRPGGSLRRTPGVEVRFTGAAVTADDEIVFAVAATDRAVVVVTDDRELRARVEAEGGNVIAPVAFLAALEP